MADPRVREMTTEDVADLVGVLTRMRSAAEPYPPERDAASDPAALAMWLTGEPALSKLVAVVDGSVVGHVQLTEPHDYLTGRAASLGLPEDAGSIAEVGKFFVDPGARRGGAGSRLYSAARAAAHGLGRTLVLAVIDNSHDAIDFYRTHGMVETGIFEGVHGTNHVFTEGDGGMR